MQLARRTIHKYHQIAKEKGYLENLGVLPSESEFWKVLRPEEQAPKQVSAVESFRKVIQIILKQEVGITAIRPDM